MKKAKRLLSLLLSGALLCSALSVQQSDRELVADAAESFDYAKALQLSLYFYECQQAGELPDWNRVEWRADATTDDIVNGGWYDAGDHVKFNLPMAYSATMLAWGMYQYPEGIENVGQWTIYQNNLEWTLDYLVDCNLGDSVIYQVGNGQVDHTWWGPVELVLEGINEGGGYERPYYTTTDSAVVSEMAAALAAGSVALAGKSTKSAEYLETAKHYFELADATRSDDAYNASDAQGFYPSRHFYDQLFWAANWLYIATGEASYLTLAESYIPNLAKQLGTEELAYGWTQCWDDVQQGGMLLYAINTKNQTYIDQVEKQLKFMTVGYNGETVTKLDGGLAYVDTWGCLRYACAAGFIAAVACDTVIDSSNPNYSTYTDFYKTQIDYCLGDNPINQCYVVGYAENSPKNVHHRTAHGSWKNSTTVPETNRHILYGALAGGPDSTGAYTDDRGNYINNEVADDYNAGFTALLCKMVDTYGGETDPAFPEPEVRDDEFYVEAKLTPSASGSSLSLKFTNHSAWPARIVDNMSYRYYMDLSEVINAGYSASDVVIRVDRDQAAMYSDVTPTVYSELKPYSGTIYYIEVTYPDGRACMPISEGRQQCETMLALVYPNYGSGWDATNDYSNTDLLASSETAVITDKITIYENGVLIYGVEPDGTTPVVPDEPDEPDEPDTTTLLGDVNCDGHRDIRDVAMLAKFVSGVLAELSEQGMINGDVNKNGGHDIRDVAMLAKAVVGAITLD